MSGRLPRAALAGVLAALAAAAVHLVGSGAGIAAGVGFGIAFIVIGLPLLGVRALDHLLYLRRLAHWKPVEGKYYSFGNIALAIEDDGRHVWVAAADLQRALRTTDAEDVIAARHAGRWRRDPRGKLQLRVDTVVQVLATAPGRMDPHTLHLRRYLEREVLFPAAQKRQRRGGNAG